MFSSEYDANVNIMLTVLAKTLFDLGEDEAVEIG
jgi:hypothetical protein